MKYKIALTLFITLFIFSCNNQEHNEKKGVIGDFEYVDKQTYKDKINPNIIELKVSACYEECEDDTGKVIINKKIADTLHLKFGHFFNCAGGIFFKDYKITGDTINFLTGNSYTVYIDKDGNEIQESISEFCYCYFEIDIIIKNIKKRISEVLIDGYDVENTF